MSRRVAAAVLGGAAAVGCSLLVDTSGLGGGGDGPVDASDGASDVTQDATIDTSDARTVDCPPDVDLRSSAKNCGRCGHDCLGGACMAARCQAVPFISGQGGAAGVATDGTELFWSTLGGDIRAKRLDGAGLIRQVAKLPEAGHIELDDTFVYVPTLGHARIVRVPKAGGGAVEELVKCAGTCVGLAVTGGAVYYSDRGTQTVRLLGPDGGTAIASGLDNPEDVTATATELFIANENANTVLRVPRAGGPTSTFLSFTDPVTVAIDGDDLWAVSQGPGVVYRRPFSGGILEPVAVSQATPTGLVLTPSAAYWACSGDGRIMRLAR